MKLQYIVCKLPFIMPIKLTMLNGKKARIVSQGPRNKLLAKNMGSLTFFFFLKKEVLRRMQAMLMLNLCSGYNPLC